ncbi:MAG: hypothetical protein ABIN39_03435 [candidate division WOR-3 bacterium]
MFFYREYILILFSLLPLFLLLLIFSKKFKKVKNYPYVDVFKEEEKSIIKKDLKVFIYIFKIILFVFSFSCLILFLSKPYIKSQKIEFLIVYIDNTPFLNLKSEKVDSIIEKFKKENDFEKILIFDSKEKIDYPFKKEKIFSGELLEKEYVIRNFVKLIQKINSPSIKKVLISDRVYEKFREDFDFIKIDNDFDILIVDIFPVIKIFSKDEKIASLIINDKQEKVLLKKGINFFDIRFDSLTFLKIFNDSIKFSKTIFLKNEKVNNLINEKSIKLALKTLGYETGKSDIFISEKDDIKKGIVFSKEYRLNSTPGKKEIIFKDKNLKEVVKNGFDNLYYNKISSIPKEPLIVDEEGNKLVSFSDEKFYVSLPLDTNLSNFILTSGFLPLLNYMLDFFSKKSVDFDRKIFDYREEVLETGLSFSSEEPTLKLKDMSKIFFILFLLATFLFLLV